MSASYRIYTLIGPDGKGIWNHAYTRDEVKQRNKRLAGSGYKLKRWSPKTEPNAAQRPEEHILPVEVFGEELL